MRIYAIVIAALMTAVEASAARLSLTSANDYIYCEVPSNSIEITGIGTGRTGIYSVPRREDLLFFAEALSERKAVCSALTADAEPVYTNRYYSSSKAAYTPIPWKIQGAYFWELYGDVFKTNGIMRMTCQTNYISSPVVHEACFDWHSTDLSKIIPFIFNDSRCVVSRSFGYMSIDRRFLHNGWLFSPNAMLFGMVTNIYADIEFNTTPIFAQAARTGSERYSVTTHTSYDDGDVNISSYDFSKNEWKTSVPAPNTLMSYAAGNYAKDRFRYTARRTLYKESLCAIENNSVVSRTQNSYSQFYYSKRDFTGRITLPRFCQGTQIVGILKAFAVVNFTHRLTNKTSTIEDSSRTIILPVRLEYECTTDDGFPVYKESEGLTPEEMYEACLTILGTSLKSSDNLSGRIDYPAYIENSSTSKGYTRASDYVQDYIEATLSYYVGSADAVFRSRVISE